MTLHPQPDNLRAVLDRAVAATTSVGEAAGGIEIRRKGIYEDVAINTDTDRLAQVFINLIANAIKYCDADHPPKLKIHVTHRGDRLHVDFIDNGSGIPKQSQSVIFEKFSRLSDQAKAGGAGLGLAICREIMDKLGGKVSYLPGQGGAAFRVTLPRAPPLNAG